MELAHAVQPRTAIDGGPLLTCNTCGLGFTSSEIQRLHMKTDWHRYNLKRRVANLPPISLEIFQEKVVKQQHLSQLANERTGRGSNGRSSGQRQVTKKDRKREEKLQRKLAEKNRPGNRSVSPTRSEASVATSSFSLGDPVTRYAPSITDDSDDDGYAHDGHIPPINGHKTLSDIEDNTEEGQDSEEEAEIRRKLNNAVEIPPNVCLVDGKKFATVEENVDYMSKKYGLYIPEKDYLTDLNGLITYLGEKVGLGNMCLYCSFQGKSLEAVRAHMIAKGHVKIPYETIEDKLELGDFYDFTSSYKKGKPVIANGTIPDDDDWEDEGSAEEDENDEWTEEDGPYVDEAGYELVLAPGMRAGHRSLQRYYKQNIRSIVPTKDGQTTVLAADTRHNYLLRSRDPVEEKEQKFAWKEQKKAQNLYYRRDKFANNQPHFRDQLLQ